MPVVVVVCFLGVTTLCGCIFHNPVAGFSLLILEVSLSHTTRHDAPQLSAVYACINTYKIAVELIAINHIIFY